MKSSNLLVWATGRKGWFDSSSAVRALGRLSAGRLLFQICGHNSIGRMPPCQGGCRGFDSLCSLQIYADRVERKRQRRLIALTYNSGRSLTIVVKEVGRSHHVIKAKVEISGSTPEVRTRDYASVAQLVEHLTLNQVVVGSNPSTRTILSLVALSGSAFTCGVLWRFKSSANGHFEQRCGNWQTH